MHTDSLSLRVLTFNVFAGSPLECLGHPSLGGAKGCDRLELQLVRLLELEPDVICLQEVYCDKVLRRYQQFFQPFGFEFFAPHRQFTERGFSWLIFTLSLAFATGFLCAVGSHIWELIVGETTGALSFGVGAVVVYSVLHRVANGSAAQGVLCGASAGALATLWRCDKLALACGKYQVYNQFRTGSLVDTLLNLGRLRGFHTLTLAHLATGARLRLVNAHPNSGPIDRYRLEQSQQLLRSLLPNDLPCILCADLNAPPTAPSVRALVSSGLKDAFVGDTPGFTWCHENSITATGMRHIPDERVDYIFTHEVEVESCEVVLQTPPVSDHYGVLAQCIVHRVSPTDE